MKNQPSNINTTRNYGNGTGTDLTHETYNSSEDDGQCLSLVRENYINDGAGIQKIIISDSFLIPKGSLSSDEKFVFFILIIVNGIKILLI